MRQVFYKNLLRLLSVKVHLIPKMAKRQKLYPAALLKNDYENG